MASMLDNPPRTTDQGHADPLSVAVKRQPYERTEAQGVDITETQLYQPPQSLPQKVAGETVSKHSAQGLSADLDVLTEQ